MKKIQPEGLYHRPIVSRSLDDLMTPGVLVELSPEQAEDCGFIEDPAVGSDPDDMTVPVEEE